MHRTCGVLGKHWRTSREELRAPDTQLNSNKNNLTLKNTPPTYNCLIVTISL
jgi:hypothetical protein